MSTRKINNNLNSTNKVSYNYKTYKGYIEDLFPTDSVYDPEAIVPGNVKTTYSLKKTNHSFEITPSYLNTSVNNGLYAMYLPISEYNRPFSSSSKILFYNQDIDDNYNDSIKSIETLSTKNNIVFYPELNEGSIKIPIRFNIEGADDFTPLSQEEEEFLLGSGIEELAAQNFHMMSDGQDHEILQYAAPTSEGCGYCVQNECVAEIYYAYCTDDGNYGGGALLLDSLVPSGATRIDGNQFYTSSALFDAYGSPQGETTVAPDEYWCGAGNYIVFAYSYETLTDYSSAQCSEFAINNPGSVVTFGEQQKEVIYSSTDCLNLSVSTSGTFSWVPPQATVYPVTGIPEGYVACSETFYIN